MKFLRFVEYAKMPIVCCQGEKRDLGFACRLCRNRKTCHGTVHLFYTLLISLALFFFFFHLIDFFFCVVCFLFLFFHKSHSCGKHQVAFLWPLHSFSQWSRTLLLLNVKHTSLLLSFLASWALFLKGLLFSLFVITTTAETHCDISLHSTAKNIPHSISLPSVCPRSFKKHRMWIAAENFLPYVGVCDFPRTRAHAHARINHITLFPMPDRSATWST